MRNVKIERRICREPALRFAILLRPEGRGEHLDAVTGAEIDLAAIKHGCRGAAHEHSNGH